LMNAREGGFRPLLELHARLLEALRACDATAAVAAIRTLFARVSATFR